MNERISQMYHIRAKQFFERFSEDYFETTLPLTVSFQKTAEPLPYEKSFADLDFQPVAEGERWGKQWDSGYFKLTGKIPQEWAGKTIWLHLEMGGEITIFDKDFVPYYGMTNTCIQIPNFRKEYYPFMSSAKGGEEFTIYAEVTGNGYNNTGKGDCDVGYIDHMKFGVFRKDVWDFRNDFKVVYSLLRFFTGGCENNPGGFQEVRKEYRRFNYRAAQLCRCLNDAIDVYANDPENAAAARQILRRELDRPAQSSAMTTTAVGHGHLDIGYLWMIRETKRKACRTFASQLHNINRYPGYVFGASQPQLYAYVKERSPKLYERVKEAYKQGKWDLQGGMWVEADTNLISGESMVRQFLHGKNFYMDEFGEDVKNLWLPDVFGYSSALPQVMKEAGVDYFTTQKISWNELNYFPHHSFVWKGLGGKEVVAHFPPCDGYNSYLEPEEMRWAEDNYQENHICDEFLTLFGAGDGGGGPLPDHIETGIRDADLEDCPHVKFGRACDFFDRLGTKKDELPIWDGELYFELHRGTLTGRGRTKLLNRKFEQKLAAAEILFSALPVMEYPAQKMDEMWKYLLMSQFHDILPGSSIIEVHEEVEKQIAAYIDEVDEMVQRAAAKHLKGDKESVTFFNTLTVPFSGLVKVPEMWKDHAVADENGKAYTLQEDVSGLWTFVNIAPFGSVTLKCGGNCESSRETCDDKTVLENDFVRYEFDADGGMTRAYDKRLDREFIKPGERGNELRLYVDHPRMFDAWEVDMLYRDIAPLKARHTAEPVVKRGALFDTIEFSLLVDKTPVRQVAVLGRNSARIDFHTEVEWDTFEQMLRIAFPADVNASEVTCEIQHGFVKRSTLQNTSWDLAKFEYCIHRYADICDQKGGVALLNNGKYGMGFFNGAFELNLLRSTNYPDETRDSGHHAFTVSYFPHKADALNEVIQEAAQLNRKPLRLDAVAEKVVLPFEFSGEGISLEAFKKAEKSSDHILRFNENCGKYSTLKLKVRGKLYRCDLMEWQEGEPLAADSDNCITLTLEPFQIATFRLKAE